MGSFADGVACLSPAYGTYASIDADRQATPEEHALVASHGKVPLNASTLLKKNA